MKVLYSLLHFEVENPIRKSGKQLKSEWHFARDLQSIMWKLFTSDYNDFVAKSQTSHIPNKYTIITVTIPCSPDPFGTHQPLFIFLHQSHRSFSSILNESIILIITLRRRIHSVRVENNRNPSDISRDLGSIIWKLYTSDYNDFVARSQNTSRIPNRYTVITVTIPDSQNS